MPNSKLVKEQTQDVPTYSDSHAPCPSFLEFSNDLIRIKERQEHTITSERLKPRQLEPIFAVEAPIYPSMLDSDENITRFN